MNLFYSNKVEVGIGRNLNNSINTVKKLIVRHIHEKREPIIRKGTNKNNNNNIILIINIMITQKMIILKGF